MNECHNKNRLEAHMGLGCLLLIQLRTIIPEHPVMIRNQYGVSNLIDIEWGVTFTICERFTSS